MHNFTNPAQTACLWLLCCAPGHPFRRVPLPPVRGPSRVWVWGGRIRAGVGAAGAFIVCGVFFKRRPSLQRRREGRAAAQGAFLALLVPFMELTQPLGVQRPSLGSQRSRTGRPVVQNRFFLFVWLPDSLSVFAPANCFPPGSPKFAPW